MTQLYLFNKNKLEPAWSSMQFDVFDPFGWMINEYRQGCYRKNHQEYYNHFLSLDILNFFF